MIINFKLYTDLFTNLFDFFTLELFISYCLSYSNQRTKRLRFIMIPLWFIYSLIPSIPHNVLIGVVIDFLYIFLYTKADFIKSAALYIKYRILYLLSSGCLYLIHTFILQDFLLQTNSDLYSSYKNLVLIIIDYIILSMYINKKRISSVSTKKTYQILFNCIMIIATITLSISVMLTGSSWFLQTDILPIVFLLIAIIIMLSLVAYRYICNTLEEQALDKQQLHKSDLELAYYANVNEGLNQLSLLRHDMKNHLIIIDEYANNHDYEKIHNYIEQVASKFNHVKLINTPSVLISSILNAKQCDCIQKDISFQLTQEFSHIFIDDFSLVTILGNVLDNAIHATEKLSDGSISLSIKQIESYLSITCENNHCENIQKKDGVFITSNRLNSHLHGFGLKSIKKTVNELNGQLDINYTESHFCIGIMVPNYK